MRINEKVLRGLIFESIKRKINESEFDPEASFDPLDGEEEIVNVKPKKSTKEEKLAHELEMVEKAIRGEISYKDLPTSSMRSKYVMITTSKEFKRNPNLSIPEIWSIIQKKIDRQKEREYNSLGGDMFDFSGLYESKLNRIIREAVDECLHEGEMEEGKKMDRLKNFAKGAAVFGSMGIAPYVGNKLGAPDIPDGQYKSMPSDTIEVDVDDYDEDSEEDFYDPWQVDVSSLQEHKKFRASEKEIRGIISEAITKALRTKY